MIRRNNNHIVKDDSIFDTNHKLFVVISEILGIRLYYSKRFHIQKRKWWKRAYVILSMISIIFYYAYFVSNYFKDHNNSISTISKIMVHLLLFLLFSIVMISMINNEITNDGFILEISKNFDFAYEKFNKVSFHFHVKKINSILQTFFFVTLIIIWGTNIYFNSVGLNIYYFYMYAKIDYSFLSFIIWLVLILFRLKLLNYELSKKLHSPIMNLPKLNVKIKKNEKSENFVSIKILNKVYLKLFNTLEKISISYRMEV